MLALGKLLPISQIVALCLFSGSTVAGKEKPSYLALGDSISFGLNPTLLPTMPGQPLPTPSQFIGYPEVIGSVDSRFNPEVNASCPGETSSSFLYGPPDNGCNGQGPTGQGPFKPVIGLHTDYSGTQVAFAVSELARNKNIKLVTLSIGANDALVALAGCAIAGGDVPACIADQLPIALNAYGRNLAQILAAIRSNYSGTLILVNSYAPTAELNAVALGLNQVTTAVGQQFGARVADAYTAFQIASALSGGDPCKAGLLIPLGPGTCDLHPSLIGQKVLAAAVEVAVAKH